jgi:indolepyruvate ferredoxin oxidoreductase alpha subunit
LNSVYNQSDSTILILDNSITGMTGHQQNPATGRDIRLREAPAIDLEALCRVLGQPRCVSLTGGHWQVEQVVSEEVARPGVSVVIARRPCALIPTGKGRPENAVQLDRDRCRRCKACIRIMCPALTPDRTGIPSSTPTAATAAVVLRVCRFDALKLGGDRHDQ